jgi:hypothetical protein
LWSPRQFRESLNSLAEAYIIPVYDIGAGASSPPFKRNNEYNVPSAFLAWEEASRPDFWVLTLHGAFQGPRFSEFTSTGTRLHGGDSDPLPEPPEVGATWRNPFREDKHLGSAVFREGVREMEAQSAVPPGTCLPVVTLHEIGHQFELGHDGGIMNGGCPPVSGTRFTPAQLLTIRRVSYPRGGY